MRYNPLIAGLWVLSSAGTVIISWHDAIASAIQLAYLALTGIGGAAILLYQKKLSVDREGRDHDRAVTLANDVAKREAVLASDLSSNRSVLDEVHSRLDAVISQREHLMQRNDQLFEQLAHLVQRVEETRCVFPTAEGRARCIGLESPPK